MPIKTYKTDGLTKILREYCIHQKEVQCVLDNTIYQRLLHLKPFVEKLGDLATPVKIHTVHPSFVHRYVLKTAPKFSRKYQKEFLCALRSFFKFLQFKGYATVRLTEALPKIPTWQLSEVSRGIPWADVEKLLKMPNRQRKNGKRNYALLLLMATYGVRYSQARKIKLKDIYWREGNIHFSSCKGGRPLTLPLYENVAEALLDYIKNGRLQECHLEEVFLQRGLPPVALGKGLHSTMKIYYKRAGISSSTIGFHAIRHAFATRLTNEEVPIKNISDLLGHRSIKSTLCYTKVDENRLRNFCQEWPKGAL